jgi:hypothetical protein
MSTRKTDWTSVVATANAINEKLKRKPRSLTIGYTDCPNGILNAYREGDLTFKQAVKAIQRWHRRQLQDYQRT